MKSLCLDARMIEHSGIGTYLKNLIPFLGKASFRLKLILPSAHAGRYPECETISCDAPIYSVQEQWSLPFLIPSCDLFWSPNFNTPLLPIRAKKRLLTLCDVFYLTPLAQLSLLRRTYARKMIYAAVANACRIITISHFSAGEIIKYAGGKREKIEVIYLGGDHAIFKDEIPLPEKFVLFVGNVKPHKNLRNLVKAFSKLVQNKGFEEYKLVIVGKKEGFIHGDALDPAPFVVFTGVVADEELVSIYQRASLLVLPSLYEGFGLPPLEAMRWECPVIVSRAGSLPEVCGDAVVYIDPYDKDDICQAMGRTLSSEQLRRELKVKGKERSQLFTWEKSAADHLRCIEECLGVSHYS